MRAPGASGAHRQRHGLFTVQLRTPTVERIDTDAETLSNLCAEHRRWSHCWSPNTSRRTDGESAARIYEITTFSRNSTESGGTLGRVGIVERSKRSRRASESQ